MEKRVDAMVMYRWAKRASAQGIPLLPGLLQRAIFYLHHSYLPHQAEIGEGTMLGYGGMGVVIHKDARIGRHCLISQQVTIGGRSGIAGVPEIGDFVRIGAGAKILGRIRLGNYAVVGANAVVIKDVPEATVVAGVPARVIRRLENPELSYRQDVDGPSVDFEAGQ